MVEINLKNGNSCSTVLDTRVCACRKHGEVAHQPMRIHSSGRNSVFHTGSRVAMTILQLLLAGGRAAAAVSGRLGRATKPNDSVANLLANMTSNKRPELLQPEAARGRPARSGGSQTFFPPLGLVGTPLEVLHETPPHFFCSSVFLCS